MPQLFKSAEEFDEWFNFDSNANKKNADMSQGQKMVVIECLHRVMRPFMLRRTKKDLETKLPNKIEINVSINLTELQVKLYQEFLLATGGVKQGSIDKKKYENMLMQLRKVCNHPYMFDNVEADGLDEFGEHLVTNSGKMLFLDKLLTKASNQKEQVLIFSGFTSMLDILEDYLMMRKFGYCRIDGSMDLADREQGINDFTAPNS